MPEILIASTFYKSRGRLESQEALRKQVQRIAEFLKQFSREPDDPGFGFQEIREDDEHAGWLARISQNLAVIIERLGDRVILAYVGMLEEARRWARGHRIRIHSMTGAVQINPSSPPGEAAARAGPRRGDFDFTPYEKDYLRALGVPEGWEERIRRIRDEPDFWTVFDQLPEEAADRIFDLALGKTVAIPLPTPPEAPTVRNLDSLRRLVEVPEMAQLPHYLTIPFEKWMLFLHPDQRVFVETTYNGPVKITGPAGTGKTVVAMHRARHLAKQGHRVLLTTFNRALRQSMTQKLDRLCLAEERQRIEVATIHKVARDLCQQLRPRFLPTTRNRSRDEEREVLDGAFGVLQREFNHQFVVDEWQEVIAKQAIRSWEEYRSSNRFGRGTPLGPAERENLWPLFESCLQELRRRQRLPWGHLARRAAEAVEDGRLRLPYTAVVVDEVQDLNSWEILLAKVMANDHLENLMLIGDTGQRIYPGGFSLRYMGIEVRGRSHRLTLSYRCSARILRTAARLRMCEIDNMEGDQEQEEAARAKSWGKPPLLWPCGDFQAENTFVFGKIRELLDQGVRPCEIAVLARKRNIVGAVRHAFGERGVQWQPIEAGNAGPANGAVYCDTMHAAKGQEFRAVFLVACRDNAIPLRPIPEGRQGELHLQRERNLLYVSMTRAREFLYMTWTGRISRLLEPIAL